MKSLTKVSLGVPVLVSSLENAKLKSVLTILIMVQGVSEKGKLIKGALKLQNYLPPGTREF